ncbi:DUF2017 domain-containing protein [Mycobacterium sp. 1274756.6]|uniref:oxidative stress transcriptional regulator AosR n=1 Tax=Mycobacterium sp. 1274756.6 TaxID=1834076 RepID=UPI0007FDD067|nr:DUF2017 domain-containing protein [Mycobacterium sp. 1274756.6]OBJ74415.1 hypothetical protein A5643_00175 [Mycobacterium sp. 1274756.6]
MRTWKRVDTAAGPRFRSAVDNREAAVLANLVGSLVEMLDEREAAAPRDELEEITGMRTGHSAAPDDATLGRLLPDFHRGEPEGDPQHTADGTDETDDPETAGLNAALRSLHEPQIIDAKREAAQRVLATLPLQGGRFELSEDDANAWIAAINDLRLALGTMLGVGPHGPERLPADHPMAGHLDVYQWLTWMQEYLVLALMGQR